MNVINRGWILIIFIKLLYICFRKQFIGPSAWHPKIKISKTNHKKKLHYKTLLNQKYRTYTWSDFDKNTREIILNSYYLFLYLLMFVFHYFKLFLSNIKKMNPDYLFNFFQNGIFIPRLFVRNSFITNNLYCTVFKMENCTNR